MLTIKGRGKACYMKYLGEAHKHITGVIDNGPCLGNTGDYRYYAILVKEVPLIPAHNEHSHTKLDRLELMSNVE
ncbi:hypothetical protein Y032_0077g1121 [Ancylostoma ceylanicum]|uniref:Uncharacterized protein n=1 Tax=Ancylostoma ceylanicum TaxID=53326 RepID=A0A016TUG8_9BILA|nr:hypothetical protein Y032_0077g1121 [Ancylostoma ceylanicum]